MGRRLRVSAASILTVLFFLAGTVAAPAIARAADWELWPKGRGTHPPEPVPPTDNAAPKAAVPASGTETPEMAAAAKAGESGGKAASAGISAGTIGKAAAIAAGVIAIGIAVGGGGGGGGGGTTTPAHH